MHRKVLIITLLPIVLLVSCGREWVDDPWNFERIYGFAKPPDASLQVLHSYYWKRLSMQTAPPYRYFIAFRADSQLIGKLTSKRNGKAMPSSGDNRQQCGSDPPEWFLPKPAARYDAWVFPDWSWTFLDRDDGTIYQCAYSP